MKKMHKAKQRSNQHKRKHNPKSTHRWGVILGKKSGGKQFQKSIFSKSKNNPYETLNV